MSKIAVYPGTFDPITNGHLDILRRSLKTFDKVYILVAINPNKNTTFDLDNRITLIKESCQDIPNIVVDSYHGLVVDYARKVKACAIIRGLRAVTDFEYEFQMANANQHISTEIEMFFIMSKSRFTFISSSIVKELAMFNAPVAELVPDCVNKALIAKFERQ